MWSAEVEGEVVRTPDRAPKMPKHVLGRTKVGRLLLVKRWMVVR